MAIERHIEAKYTPEEIRELILKDLRSKGFVPDERGRFSCSRKVD